MMFSQALQTVLDDFADPHHDWARDNRTPRWTLWRGWHWVDLTAPAHGRHRRQPAPALAP